MSQNPYEPPLESSVPDAADDVASPPGKPLGPATKVRYLVLALACATSFVLYLHRYSWGVAKPEIKQEYNLSDSQLGVLDSAFGVAYAIGQIPGGLAGDVLGPAFVLPLIILLWSLAVGFTPLGRGMVSFLGLRATFGATQAGAYPNLSKVSRNWFARRTRTTMQGLIATLSGRMGAAFAPLIIGSLLMGVLGLGWRESLYIIAGVGVLLAVIVWLLLRNSPAEHPWSNEAEQKLVEADEPASDSQKPVRFTRHPLAWISFSFLLLHLFCSAGADQLYVYWIPSFLEEAKGMTKVQMGIFASLPLFGGALGGMLGGMLNDLLIRLTGRRGLARSVIGFSGKAISGVCVIFALTIDDGRMMMVVIAAAKFFTDWSQPTVWGAVTDIGGRASGRVFGVVNTVGSLGGFVFANAIGIAKQHFGTADVIAGWNAVFWIIIGTYFVSGLFWFAVNSNRRLVIEDEETKPPVED